MLLVVLLAGMLLIGLLFCFTSSFAGVSPAVLLADYSSVLLICLHVCLRGASLASLLSCLLPSSLAALLVAVFAA